MVVDASCLCKAGTTKSQHNLLRHPLCSARALSRQCSLTHHPEPTNPDTKNPGTQPTSRLLPDWLLSLSTALLAVSHAMKLCILSRKHTISFAYEQERRDEGWVLVHDYCRKTGLCAPRCVPPTVSTPQTPPTPHPKDKDSHTKNFLLENKCSSSSDRSRAPLQAVGIACTVSGCGHPHWEDHSTHLGGVQASTQCKLQSLGDRYVTAARTHQPGQSLQNQMVAPCRHCCRRRCVSTTTPTRKWGWRRSLQCCSAS